MSAFIQLAHVGFHECIGKISNGLLHIHRPYIAELCGHESVMLTHTVAWWFTHQQQALALTSWVIALWPSADVTWYQGACYQNFIQQYKHHFVIYQVVLFYCDYHNIQLDISSSLLLSSSLLYMTLVKMGENSTLSTKDHVRGPGRYMIGNEPAEGQCMQGQRGTAAKAWRGWCG